MNGFKGLHLIECLKNCGWRFVTLYRRWWPKPSPRKGNARRQSGRLRRPYREQRRKAKGKGGRERHTRQKAEFQRITRREKKFFFKEECKEIEENNRVEKPRDLSRKLEISREHFMQGWAQKTEADGIKKRWQE